MKLNYFYGSVAVRQCNGYTENLEFNVTEANGLIFRYPYGDATPEDAEAINKFIKTITDAYNVLSNQIDRTNKTLKLEQYAPVVSSPESTDVLTSPQPSHGICSNNLDCTDLVAHSEAEQERLDMEEEVRDAPFEEAEIGADGDIDKPQSEVETVIATVRGSSNEGLIVIGEE
jgi:hypothetical protein